VQALTAPPRNHLTAAQVESLISGDSVTVVPGCELLDTSNQVVEDISTYMVKRTGGIRWDNRTPIHGSCQISLIRELAWGRDRIRPYRIHSRGDLSAKFYLGVYVTDRPVENRAVTPMTYDVSAYDLLYLLQQTGPDDTWVAPVGEKYFDELQRAMVESGIGTSLLLDGDVQDLVIPETRVWALLEAGVSWLRIITELLKEIGYGPPWMEPEGNFRSRFYLNPAVRAPDRVLDVGDVRANLVGRDRSVVITTGDIANSWRFIMANAAVTPVEGAGIYTPPVNESEGPNSITALGGYPGGVRFKRMYLQAADHASLVAQGDQIVAADKASVRTISLQVARLASVMGQDDVYQLIDAGVTEKAAAASWSLNFDNSLGDLVLGGDPAAPLESVETQVKATVTSAAPLNVVIDGATVASFANALDAATYSVNDRVTVTVRNPQPPLVQGVES
jgi:hypothetical protein